MNSYPRFILLSTREKFMASSWQSNDKSRQFEPLRRNIHAEVLIIGGGMAGILTEYLLKQKSYNLYLLMREK